MNDYEFSDYGIFTEAINRIKTLKTQLDAQKQAITECKTKVGDQSVFMGPAADSANAGLDTANSRVVLLSDNFTTISDYFVETAKTYKAGDTEASNKILSISNGKISVQEGNSITLSGNTNQDQIYNYLASKGLNSAAICGILANIKRESGYRTDALGDGGTSYGLCQWHNSRWEDLKNYCNQNNLNPDSMEGQLAFLSYEFENKYSELYGRLKNVPNTPEGAYQAAYDWTVTYERPANMDAAGQTRGGDAQSLWNSYNQSTNV